MTEDNITLPPEMLPRADDAAEVVVLDADSHVMMEFVRERREDGYWVGCWLPQWKAWFGQPIGPFDTQDEADRAIDDLKKTSLALGSIEVPSGLAN